MKKYKIPEQLIVLKLSETIENATKPEKEKMEVITPVVTEDIVAHLLQNVNEDGKFSKTYKLIVSEANLVTAWLEIKSRPGMLAKNGVDTNDSYSTIENLPLKWFKETSELLMVERYSYKLARTVKIPKKEKGKYRKLILTNPYDKIIQKAFHRVLNVVFEGYSEWEKTNKETFQTYHSEVTDYTQIFKKRSHNEYWIRKFKIKPIFSPISYGFRPKRGVHSAIRVMENTWYPNWFASCDISKAFDNVNRNILVKRLREYIEDEQVIGQIRKMLNVQIIDIKLDTKNGTLSIPQGSILSPLLFNLYMHSLDEFVEKIIENVTRIDRRKPNPEYRKMTRSNSRDIEKLSAKVRYKITKKQRKLVKRHGIKILINDPEKMPVRMYYARYADDFLLGFFMPKIQTKLIMEDITKFITDDLKLEVTGKHLRHTISDKTSFLGFEIRRISPEKFKYSRSKKLEAYKRHKNRVLRRGAQEYEGFLKMTEWLGRRAIASTVNEKIAPKKHIVKEKELREIVPVAVQQEDWFYNKHKHNKKMELALKNRYENQQYRFKRWIKAKQDLMNSREIIELAKMIGKGQTDRLNTIREDTMKLLKELVGSESEKAYILKLQSIKKDPTRVTRATRLISKLEILFPKKQIIEELKSKGIMNSKGMPSAAMQKTTLPDYEIIDWYTTVARGLLSYYGCTANLNDLRRLVNWTLRYSLFATIGSKHKKSTKWTIDNFGFDPKVIYEDKVIASFPAVGWVNSCRKEYPSQAWDNNNLRSIINSERIRLNQRVTLFDKCGVGTCDSAPEHVHHIRHLHRIWKGKFVTVKTKRGHRSPLLQQTVQSTLARKQIPLCQKCHNKIHQGILTIEDLDEKYIITGIERK
jgi:retron-type reverse transcriptase